MISRQKVNLIDFILFVIVENLNVLIVQEVKIDLVPIVADSHHKSRLYVEGPYFLVKRQLSEFIFTHGLSRLHLKLIKNGRRL